MDHIFRKLPGNTDGPPKHVLERDKRRQVGGVGEKPIRLPERPERGTLQSRPTRKEYCDLEPISAAPCSPTRPLLRPSSLRRWRA